MTDEQIFTHINGLQGQWNKIHQDLHRIPELAHTEIKTQAYIIDYLNKIGIENHKCGVTGVYGILRSKKPGKTIAFRADIDGLAVCEKTGVPYASIHEGRMHACGHDAHTAMLLGLASVLKEYEHILRGSFVFLFQPAEETTTGAVAMIEDGALSNPKPDCIIGIHVWNLPFGQILVKPGPIMAESIFFKLDLRGRGGHGAQPHLCKNPISAAAHIISTWESSGATMIDPLEPVVISVCKINGGDTGNVIPNKVSIEGTIRVYSENIGNQVLQNMRTLAENIGHGYGITAQLEVISRTPVTINNCELAEKIQNVLNSIYGEKVINTAKPAMTAEDFGVYGKYIPAVFLWLGITGKDEVYPLHNERFFVNEDILPIGISALSRLAMKLG